MEENFVKITNTTYQLLDFFPDGDPLKYKAKEKALAILENLTLLSDANGWVSLKKEKAASEVLDDIEVLENYLKLGKYQGWIDAVNFLILIKEYSNIRNQISPPKGVVKEMIESTFMVKKERTVQVIPEIRKSETTVGPEDLTGRQRKILEILTKKDKAQVSDFIKELPDITKRTIRRDLDGLLKSGKVVRVGEWNQVFYQVVKLGQK